MQEQKYLLRSVAFGLAVTALTLALPSVGAKISWRPIKPNTKSSTPATDEQQAILAVRQAKVSVVSIVTRVKIQDQPATTSILTITPENQIDNSYGTGFVWSDGLHIVSNSHVVQTKDATFDVVLPDGSTREALVVGVDKARDIAVLKITGSPLTPVIPGNSDDLETGQTVFAIGNSLGRYQNTVSRGVVSGLGRNINPITSNGTQNPRLLGLIQTDAAINPGNSGGPLVNMMGEVIGMNTAIDTTGQGIGFAVPMSTIKQAAAEIISTGRVSRPYLGIYYLTIDGNLRARKSLAVGFQGAFVAGVGQGSAAEQAHIMEGDIITAVNKQKLSETVELDEVLSAFHPGDQVMMTIIRGKEEILLPVILGELK